MLLFPVSLVSFLHSWNLFLSRPPLHFHVFKSIEIRTGSCSLEHFRWLCASEWPRWNSDSTLQMIRYFSAHLRQVYCSLLFMSCEKGQVVVLKPTVSMYVVTGLAPLSRMWLHILVKSWVPVKELHFHPRGKYAHNALSFIRYFSSDPLLITK